MQYPFLERREGNLWAKGTGGVTQETQIHPPVLSQAPGEHQASHFTIWCLGGKMGTRFPLPDGWLQVQQLWLGCCITFNTAAPTDARVI